MRPQLPMGRPSARIKAATALVGVQGAVGSLGCFGGVFLIWGVFIVRLSRRPYNPSFEFAEFAVVAVYPVAVVTIILSAGLLRLRPWARTAAIVWSIVFGLLTPWPLAGFLLGQLIRAPNGYPLVALLIVFSLPVVIATLLIAMLSGRQQRLFFSAPPPTPAPPQTPLASTRAAPTVRKIRIWPVVALTTGPWVITVVSLASLAYPHEYTFADMRAMPEASLRYPRAAVVQVSGNGYVEGGFDAPATPPEVDTTFKVAVSTGQVLDGYRLLDWYRRQLTAMGWQYAGCVSTARPPNNAVVPGWYFFGRHPDEVFSISFDAGTGTYETRLDLQTTVSASSKVAAGSFGGCQGLLF